MARDPCWSDEKYTYTENMGRGEVEGEGCGKGVYYVCLYVRIVMSGYSELN